MSTWRSSAQWRPPRFGWFVPTEFPPFVAWLTPFAMGVVVIAVDRIMAGDIAPWPERFDQIGLFRGFWAATLVYSPLWGFPAIVAAIPVREALLSNGWFGWASALAGGAVAGLAIPIFLGRGLWLDGPLYGAVYLSVQSILYSAIYPAKFEVW